MNDLMFKANNKEAWDEFADTFPEAAAILIDELGPIVTTPPTFDAEGNLIAPEIVDSNYHVNVRVLTPVVMSSDDPPVEIDVCAALAAGASGVVWLDPSTVSSPSRIWAGGMNYWTLSGGAE